MNYPNYPSVSGPLKKVKVEINEKRNHFILNLI